MSRKSTIFTVLATLFIVFMFMGVAGVLSQNKSPLVISAEVRSGISYQAYLNDTDGNPLTGSHNFKFELYNAANGGDKWWQKSYNNVTVNEGLVDIILEVNPDDFHGAALWLAITVDGQLLSPRTELLPVPYAMTVRPGASIIGDPDFPALFVSNTGNGDGLRGTSSGGYGVAGSTDDNTAWTAAGVYGFSTHDQTFGVLGESLAGVGVEGQVSNIENQNSAVVGYNSGGGAGVVGYAENNDGVIGISTSADNVAGRFENQAEGGAGLLTSAGDDSSADLILGGLVGDNVDDGIITTDPGLPGSDLVLVSNDAAVVVLDANDDEEGHFVIMDNTFDEKLSVDEQGNTIVSGDLTVAGNLNAAGHTCAQYGPYTENNAYFLDVPNYCIDQFCWVIVESDAIIGAFYPGLYWPVLYMQNSGDNSWVAGPAINIAGMTISEGTGVNGDESLEVLASGGVTAGGGRLLLWDDGAGNYSPDQWTLELQPLEGELSTATVYACPMGRPMPVP